MLNDSLDFEGLPADVQSAFLGRTAEKRWIDAGTRVFKFTSFPLYDGSRVTPWWSFVDSVVPPGEGLDGVLERAGRLGVDVSEFSRARSAVTRQWNSMAGLLIAKLIQPVYGFVGRCAAQPMDDAYGSRVVWIGGAWQAYIPNLTPAQIIRD